MASAEMCGLSCLDLGSVPPRPCLGLAGLLPPLSRAAGVRAPPEASLTPPPPPPPHLQDSMELSSVGPANSIDKPRERVRAGLPWSSLGLGSDVHPRGGWAETHPWPQGPGKGLQQPQVRAGRAQRPPRPAAMGHLAPGLQVPTAASSWLEGPLLSLGGWGERWVGGKAEPSLCPQSANPRP